MRRSLSLVAAAVALAALAAPALAAAPVNVPGKFSSKLARVRSRSGVPVRLPSRLDAGVRPSRVFGTVEGLSSGRYDLGLGIGRSCHQATACFVAEFFAKKGAKPSIKRRVALARGITGRFRGISCGASCAAAEVEWVQGGVLYDVQYKGNRKQMVGLANSAIRGGAR
jgi:hypothetical protein